uniref:Uncharacterized protein n=1 Tax=Klebsiella pneumoniae TaxID=573 RepID=A0A024HVB1_KLEPN|nr:hypothetical protein PENVA_0146 [Klebsiella pneumoniae]
MAEDGFLKHGESKELARMALAAMENSLRSTLLVYLKAKNINCGLLPSAKGCYDFAGRQVCIQSRKVTFCLSLYPPTTGVYSTEGNIHTQHVYRPSLYMTV